MRIDTHSHGMHAEKDPITGRRKPPVMSAWRNTEMTPAEHVRQYREHGIEKVVLLDPPEVTFELKEVFGDFVAHCPQVVMDESSPEEITSIIERGASGIKFIASLQPYGSDCYLPLYQAVRDCGGLAVFHTGYLLHDYFDPGGFLARPNWINILHMRPAELDRINRAFPDLRILMSHFGNPWWDEAFCMMRQNKNIYADFSGGSCMRQSLDMWKAMFAPNGKLDTVAVSKLCYGSDASVCSPGFFEGGPMMEFYDAFYDKLNVPAEIRELIDRGNILNLLKQR